MICNFAYQEREIGIGGEKRNISTKLYIPCTIKTQINNAFSFKNGLSWHGNSEKYPEYPIFEGVFFLYSWASK